VGEEDVVGGLEPFLLPALGRLLGGRAEGWREGGEAGWKEAD